MVCTGTYDDVFSRDIHKSHFLVAPMIKSPLPISIAGTQLSVPPEFRVRLFQAEQGGKDGIWQRNRHPFLTSTMTGSAMNPKNVERLWFERMKLASKEEADDLGKARMQRGSILEPVARMCFESMMDVRVYERGLWVSTERPHTAVSPDGFVLEGDNQTWNLDDKVNVTSPDEIPTKTLVEIKCPSSSPKMEGNGTFIRDTYLVQVMDAMDKLNCDKCYFVILESEREMAPIRRLLSRPPDRMPDPGKLHVFLVHRSQFFIDAMRLAVDYITSCLEQQVEPVAGVPFSEKEYENLFKKIKVDIITQEEIPEHIFDAVLGRLKQFLPDSMEIDQ